MKQLIITGICLLAAICGSGQNIKVERSTEKNLLIPPQDIDAVRSFTDSSYLAIKLIQMGTTIGQHPDIVGQDALLSDLLLLVRERFDDKLPVSANFWIKGQFYNPRDYTFRKADKSLTFRHGSEKDVKSTTLFISTNGIKVK